MKAKRIISLAASLVAWVLLYFNLQEIVDWIFFNLLKLNAESHLIMTLHFFVFEVPKIFLLLFLIIFAVGLVQSFFSAEKTRKALEGKSLFTGNVLASSLGIVTPFCSCSAIPLFLGFVEAGIPIGVTFSFLIAAPMINEVALVLLIGLFGWKVSLIYVATGLTIATLSGFIIEKLKLQRYVADWVFEKQAKMKNKEEQKMSMDDRFDMAFDSVKEIVGKIWIYIIIGVGVGAAAHGYVPEDFLASSLGSDSWYAVPLAILVGIPLYSNAAGVIPIVSVLIEKGVSLGTALAFMMSVIGLSLPEIIILKKVLKWQLIVVFVGVVAIGILAVGYMLNAFL